LSQQKPAREYAELALGQAALFALLVPALYELVAGNLSGITPTELHGMVWWACWGLALVYGAWVSGSGLVRRDWLSLGAGVAAVAGAAIGGVGIVVFHAQAVPLGVCFAAGGAGVVVNYVLLFRRQLSVGAKAALNVANAIFFAVILVLFVNIVSSRLYKRIDVTSSKFSTLASATSHTLKGLKENVKFYIFMTRQSALYRFLHEVMERFRQENTAKVDYEFIDPDIDQEHASKLVEKFNISENEIKRGAVLVQYGGRQTKLILTDELANVARDATGVPVAVHALNAEQPLVSTLRGMERGVKVRVAFFLGHGAKLITPGDNEKSCALLTDRLRRENMDVFSYDIGNALQPPECNLLIVAGPTSTLDPTEAALVRQYVRQGGKILLMLDPVVNAGRDGLLKTGLEDVAVELGVRPQDAIITVIEAMIGGYRYAGGLQRPVACKEYLADSPITSEFYHRGENTYFPLARPLSPAKREPGSDLEVAPLVGKGGDCWGETDIASYEAGAPVFEKDKDWKLPRVHKDKEPPPLILAYAVQQKAPGNNGIPRAVIVGDSDFIADRYITRGSNSSLILNAISWLTAKPGEAIEGIHPKIAPRLRLDIPPDEYEWVINPILFGLPALCVAGGIIVWVLRRS